MEAPLLKFAQQIAKQENPKDVFILNGVEFKEGDKVRGTWVFYDGRTFFSEGVIVRYPETGLWVQQANGGITDIKSFWTLELTTPK